MSLVDESEKELNSDTTISSSDHRLSSSSCSAASKTELIQRILDSFKITSSIRFRLSFAKKNQLGNQPNVDDLLDKIDSRKSSSYQFVNIDIENDPLNEKLSVKEKESILRIILRREQIVQRYLNQSNGQERNSSHSNDPID